MHSAIEKKLQRYMDPVIMTVVIRDAFSHRKLVTLAGREGIEYPGIRLSSVPREQLAHAVACEFMERQAMRTRIIPKLNEAYARDIRLISAISLPEIKKHLRDIGAVAVKWEPGALIWALLVDERKGVNRELPSFLKRMSRACREIAEDKVPDEKQAVPGSIIDEIEGDLATIVRELELLEKQNDELRETIQKNNSELDSIKKQHHEAKERADGLAHDKGVLKKEKQQLEKEVGKLTEKLRSIETSVPRSPKFRLRAQLHSLEKENRKLKHELTTVSGRFAGEREALRKAHHASAMELEKTRVETEKLRSELATLKTDYDALAGELREQEARFRNLISPETPVAQGSRLGIFIDGQNVFFLSRYCYNKRLDYKKLLTFLVRDRHLVKALCYIVDNPEIDQEGFVKMLTCSGYAVRTRTLIRRADGSAKANWDVGIAADAIMLVEEKKLDIVVLVTCDGDFADLARVLKSKGVRVEVAGFPNQTAVSLQKEADRVYFLEENLMYN